MKKFEKPEMEVIVFEAEDIIITSPAGDGDNYQNFEDKVEIEESIIMKIPNSSNYDLKNSISQGTQNGQEESETIDLTKGSTTEPTTETTTETTTDPTVTPDGV